MHHWFKVGQLKDNGGIWCFVEKLFLRMEFDIENLLSYVCIEKKKITERIHF
jgi:hypothetical protein